MGQSYMDPSQDRMEVQILARKSQHTSDFHMTSLDLSLNRTGSSSDTSAFLEWRPVGCEAANAPAGSVPMSV
jgi:hypothetical protein